MTIPDPWVDLRPGDAATRATRRFWADELVREIWPRHPLFGSDWEVVAVRAPASDDVLLDLLDGRVALVHATFNSRERPPWPTCRIVADHAALSAAIKDLDDALG